MRIKAVVENNQIRFVRIVGMLFIKQIVDLLRVINPPYWVLHPEYKDTPDFSEHLVRSYENGLLESARHLTRIGRSDTREYCYREGGKLIRTYKSGSRMPEWFISGYGYNVKWDDKCSVQIDVKPVLERLQKAGFTIEF